MVLLILEFVAVFCGGLLVLGLIGFSGFGCSWPASPFEGCYLLLCCFLSCVVGCFVSLGWVLGLLWSQGRALRLLSLGIWLIQVFAVLKFWVAF